MRAGFYTIWRVVCAREKKTKKTREGRESERKNQEAFRAAAEEMHGRRKGPQ